MSAILSSCGQYRWRLERDIQDTGIVVALIGINPSTADATVNDQTIRKDIGFGERLGWRKIIKGNVFAYRATDVKKLRAVVDHNEATNADHLRRICADADMVIPCWGDRTKLPPELRPWLVRTLALLQDSGKPLMCFGLTQGGDPRHTLMLGYATPLIPWPDCGEAGRAEGES